MPEPREIGDAWESLARHDNKVDFIVTHQCAWRIKKFLGIGDNEANILDVFFDELREKCAYKKWFFGSLHLDKPIPPREVALFRRFAEMTGEPVLLGRRRAKPQKRPG